MPINVICPGCHTRFKVSDKFAGKSGACPKCKGKIEVPLANDEVVVHEREFEAGAKDAQGRSVLKPVARTDTKFKPVIMVAVLAIIAMVLVAAVMLRGQDIGMLVLAGGALALAPPLAWAGYTFLRDDELEGFQGMTLAIRTLACGLAYAGLWGVYAYLIGALGWTNPQDYYFYAVMAGIMLPIGGGAAFVCYDLDFGTGAFHYSLYLIVTLLLRLLIGLPLLGPEATEQSPDPVSIGQVGQWVSDLVSTFC